MTDALSGDEAAGSASGLSFSAPVSILKYRRNAAGDDTLLYASSGSEAIWEMPADALLRDTASIWAMVLPEDVCGLRRSLDRSVVRLSAWEHEWRIEAPSGRRKWLHGRGVPQRDGAAVVWDVVILDFSRQKEMEAALREKERLFHDLAENVPGAIFRYTIGPDGQETIQYMSGGCEALWELTAESIRENPKPLWDMIDPQDLPAMTQSVANSARDQTPWRHTWRVVTPSGKRKFLEGRGIPTRLPDGSTLWNSLVLDVTEQQEAQIELSHLAEAAETADRSKTMFLAQMSHELRTPLNSILGFAEVMREEMFGALSNPRYKEYAGLIHASAAHLSNLIADILDVSTIEAGRLTLHEEVVGLDDCLDFVMGVLAHRFAAKSITLRRTGEAQGARLRVDAAKLKRALLNVLGNAAIHTPFAGWVELYTGLEHERGFVIRVIDSGPGFPLRELSDLAQPFRRGSRSHLISADGMGLGLFITRSIMELHGGTLVMGNRPKAGADVALCLPKGRLCDPSVGPGA